MEFRRIHNQSRQEAGDGVHRGPSERSMRRFFAVMGLMPSFRGGNGQPLAEAAEALREEPDFAADAEFIERELFVPEDQNV